MKSTLAIALGAFVLTASVALAQTPAAPAAAPAAPAASKMAPAAHAKGAMAKPRSAASLACSAKADSMKVHGKKRKAFMSTCKKEGAAK